MDNEQEGDDVDKFTDQVIDKILASKYQWDEKDKKDNGSETYFERYKRKRKAIRKKHYKEYTYKNASESEGEKAMIRKILRSFKKEYWIEGIVKCPDFNYYCLALNPVTYYCASFLHELKPENFEILTGPETDEYKS